MVFITGTDDYRVHADNISSYFIWTQALYSLKNVLQFCFVVFGVTSNSKKQKKKKTKDEARDCHHVVAARRQMMMIAAIIIIFRVCRVMCFLLLKDEDAYVKLV